MASAFLHLAFIASCVFLLLAALAAWALLRLFRFVASVVEKMPKRFVLRVTCLSVDRASQIFLNGEPRATIALPTIPANAALVDLVTSVEPKDYSTGAIIVHIASAASTPLRREEHREITN